MGERGGVGHRDRAEGRMRQTDRQQQRPKEKEMERAGKIQRETHQDGAEKSRRSSEALRSGEKWGEEQRQKNRKPVVKKESERER